MSARSFLRVFCLGCILMKVRDRAYHKLDREPNGVGEEYAREVGEWCHRRCLGQRGAIDREGRKSLHVGRSQGAGNGNGNGNGGTKL